MQAGNWIRLRQDAETGIETIRAHFLGHAYEPHWHDSYLVGFTEQGLQQFHCRNTLHSSRPGQVFMLEPGEIHDGHAPAPDGFTYSMLYLDPAWLEREMHEIFGPSVGTPGFVATLVDDPGLTAAIACAFRVLQETDMRIVRQTALDTVLAGLGPHLHRRTKACTDVRLPTVAQRSRDYLHAHYDQDISLDELAEVAGVDRFRLTRGFKHVYGLAPHAYLIQLRLSRARRLLAHGETPADVAAMLGFADQSHLGRWFRRAYGLTPAAYRSHCTKLPDA
ncbi:AraC family transcriptional regulator [Noviherbaspirillum malthae]|jgi:AraC-like DNA-binding protein|uniref:AraC family transcriptional regulator n=1 Tax=Noviherbaspirillum malthae TaxID=1260987 RepID=UPI00188F166A|nr:AraC family transcriptional regulator [Noviherbaspirillum malthae]